MRRYDHKRIEKKWQRVWAEQKLYQATERRFTRIPKPQINADETQRPSASGLRRSAAKPKCFVLDMFPYPSGDGLHVGHPKGYIATDVYSRMKRMQGHSILHPMGWDAFGLPAENYAIQNKIHPAKAVAKNIKRFKKQLELLGFNYDWSREINTTDPNYYKWTQWIFLQMFHRGLAYQSNEPINWCPSCKTGLANEDLEDGRCERCGSVVEKRAIPQWVLKITDYADRLLADLDRLNWPEHIKEQQRNWIGRSHGAEIIFEIRGSSRTNADSTRTVAESSQRSSALSQRHSATLTSVKVFTTRPDTLFGATYLVLAPEHSFFINHKSCIINLPEVERYIGEAKKKTEIERTSGRKEKTGAELKGIKAINPASGEEIPVWVADYVLAEYGTGAIMAVPAHDERDFEFAQKYQLPIKEVIRRQEAVNTPLPPSPLLRGGKEGGAFVGEGLLINSGKFNGMPGAEAKKAITELVGGRLVTTYKLRDWVFSRQRYWGEPIPLVFCENCKKRVEIPNSQFPIPTVKDKGLRIKDFKFSKGERANPGWIGIPENKLPVTLPNVKSYEPTGTGESPLAGIAGFVNTKCPKCGGPAKRETNTMPQWAGSCWYYLAYIMREDLRFKIKDLSKNKKSRKKFERWLPVDMYVGGAEHATRHLIYARFWHKFLQDIDVVSTAEPFQRLQNVGLILAADGRKMSKRFGNVLNPDEIVERFGADSLRVYEMFMGPFNQAIAWSTDSLVGARRFLERVWRLRFKITDLRFKKAKFSELKSCNLNLESVLHRTIKKVGDDIEQFRFNTAVSSLMILVNALEKEERIAKSDFETLLKLLAPFAPHLAEELWMSLGRKKSVHTENWPTYDTQLAERGEITIVVQVNGKVRGSFAAPHGEREEVLKSHALALPAVKKWVEGKEIQKVIVVKDRLVNIVIRDPNNPNS